MQNGGNDAISTVKFNFTIESANDVILQLSEFLICQQENCPEYDYNLIDAKEFSVQLSRPNDEV